MLKIGIVGVGGISGAHIEAWKKIDAVNIVAMCDVRLEQMALYDAVTKYTDINEMLRKEELDILDVIVPTYLHKEIVLKALEKGIHVLCEKPISLEVEDVKTIYEVAERNQVNFMVAQVIRFWPEYVKLREIHNSGKYGKLLSGTMKRLSSKPKWSRNNGELDLQRSGGVPYDLHIHDLDFMVYTFGNPKHIVSHWLHRPEQDYLNVIYEYDDFAVATEASWYAAKYPFRAEFRFLYEGALVTMEGGKMIVYENDGSIVNLSLIKTSGYFNEIQYFTDCIINNRKPTLIKPEELESVIRILNNI